MADVVGRQRRDKHDLLTRVSTLHGLHPNLLPLFERTLLQSLVVSASDSSFTSCSEAACALCVVAQNAPLLWREVEAFLGVDAASMLDAYCSYLQDEPMMWLNMPPELVFAACVGAVLAPEPSSAARQRMFVREAKLSTDALSTPQPEEVFVQTTQHLVTVLHQVRQSKPKNVFKQLYRTLQAAIQPPSPAERPSSPPTSNAHQDDPSDRPSEENMVQVLFPSQIELSSEDAIALLLNVTRIAMTFYDAADAEASYESNVQMACNVVYAVALLLHPSALATLITSHLKTLRFASS